MQCWKIARKTVQRAPNTTADIIECSIGDVVKDGWPFYLAVILVVAIMVFFPDAVLLLPNLVYGPNGG